MRCFDWKLRATMTAKGMDWVPIWAFDHAKPHDYWYNGTDPGLPSCGWCTRLRLPKHSCDFQRVIEHTFGRFKRFLHEAIYAYCASKSSVIPIPQMRTLCDKALSQAADPAAIAKDVAKLPGTLMIVGQDKGTVFQGVVDGHLHTFVGTGGDWPEKAWR